MQKSGDEEHEGPRGEEQDDDGDMCIVCMTEKRSACLVHGRTAHQVRRGAVMFYASIGC